MARSVVNDTPSAWPPPKPPPSRLPWSMPEPWTPGRSDVTWWSMSGSSWRFSMVPVSTAPGLSFHCIHFSLPQPFFSSRSSGRRMIRGWGGTMDWPSGTFGVFGCIEPWAFSTEGLL